MSTICPFFWDSEIENTYENFKELLPTKHDCLLYVYSSTHVKSEKCITHQGAAWKLMNLLKEIPF